MGALADALTGPTGRFVKWSEQGRTPITGSVIGIEVRQCRKYDPKLGRSTDELETWSDGSPKQEALIGLATSERIDADDDGNRTVVINLWGQQKQALREACEAVGRSEPAIGDTFAAAWTSGAGGPQDPRKFAYKLTPGTGLAAAIADPFAGLPTPDAPHGTPVDPWAQPAAQAPAFAQPAPAPTPVPAAPVKPASPVELATQLIRLGVSDDQVSSSTGLDANTVAALRNAVTAGSI